LENTAEQSATLEYTSMLFDDILTYFALPMKLKLVGIKKGTFLVSCERCVSCEALLEGAVF